MFTLERELGTIYEGYELNRELEKNNAFGKNEEIVNMYCLLYLTPKEIRCKESILLGTLERVSLLASEKV